MKSVKALLLGMAGAAMIATAANATDITPIVPPPAPPAPPTPAFSWGGAYAGVVGNLVDCGFCIDQLGGQVGINAGYNFAAGSMVFGIQALAFYTFSPVSSGFALEADARAGFALGERTLIYALAGIGRFFPGATYFTAGGGAEFAVTDRVSVFAQVTPYWFIPGFTGPIWRFGGGVNFHFAY